MTDPRVSVMMPAYNASAFIAAAIESVLSQTFADWELVIVDDGSTDDTSQIIARYDDVRIRTVRQANGGESVARNTALKHMRGDLLAFLDADDLFLPQHLALTTSYLQSHPDQHAVYSDGFYCDQDGQKLQPLSSDRRGPYSGDIFEQVVRASDVFGPPTCVVLRRDPIDKHDLRFDPQIVIGPDWDFLTRYSQWTQFGHIPERTCLYRVHQTNVTLRVDRQRRALYLARCRQKAIQLQRFDQCSLETRRAVFYDLLVRQLAGFPQRQSEIVAWSQFRALPQESQAQILRLMAAEAILEGNAGRQPAATWLAQANALHPADWRARLLSTVQRANPSLARRLLRLKRRGPQNESESSPFGRLQ